MPTVGKVKQQPQPEAKKNPTAASTEGWAGLEKEALQCSQPSDDVAPYDLQPRDAQGRWGGAGRRRGLAQKVYLSWSGGGTQPLTHALLVFLGTNGSH